MKKRIWNQVKAVTATAITLTMAVLPCALMEKNVKGTELDFSSLGLEQTCVWTDEKNFRADLTVKLTGLNKLKEKDSTEEAFSEEEAEEPEKEEYSLITYISEYFCPEEDSISENTRADSVEIINQNGKNTEITRFTSTIEMQKLDEGEISFVFPVWLREEYQEPEEDMMYPVLQEEPLQKDQPGAAVYLQRKSDGKMEILAEGESPVLHVSMNPYVSPAEPTDVPAPTLTDMPDPAPTDNPDKSPTDTPVPEVTVTQKPAEHMTVTPTKSPVNTPTPVPVVSQSGQNGFGIISGGTTITPVSGLADYQSSGTDVPAGAAYKTAGKPKTGDQAETGMFVVLLLFAAMSAAGIFVRLKGKNER